MTSVTHVFLFYGAAFFVTYLVEALQSRLPARPWRALLGGFLLGTVVLAIELLQLIDDHSTLPPVLPDGRFLMVFFSLIYYGFRAGLVTAVTLVAVSLAFGYPQTGFLVLETLLVAAVGALVAVALRGRPLGHHVPIILSGVLLIQVLTLAVVFAVFRDTPGGQNYLDTFAVNLVLLELYALSLAVLFLENRERQSKFETLRQTERELRHKAAFLEAQLNATTDGVLVVDAQGKKILQNRRTNELWKIPREVAEDADDARQVQHVLAVVKHPDAFAARVAYLYAHPDVTSRDEIELLDGTTLDRYAAPVKGEDGHDYGRIWIFHDVTARKQAERELLAETERLAVTLRSIGDGVITTDTQGKVLIMNAVAETLCGWSQEEALGRPLSEVFQAVDETTRQPRENLVESVLNSGKVREWGSQTLLLSRDGTERWISDSMAPVQDKTGYTLGIVFVFRDVTQQRRLLAHMQRIEKLDSLGVLAGGIAHDFNNLLSGIFSFVSLARLRTGEESPASRHLDRALGVFERARSLTRQLLTFSKGGAPVRRVGDLGHLIRSSAAFALSGSKLACQWRVPDDLWPAEFDETQIGQVIDNLVINAKQAMPDGGTLRIGAENLNLAGDTVPGLPNGTYVKITVQDEGPGIPLPLQKRVFDPFFTTKPNGSGLGLSTCYSIVQKHQGSIDLVSTPDGTTFHIYLPALPAANVPPQSPVADTHRGQGTIVVMDDEDFIRESLGALLKALGYAVLEAGDGESALKLCFERRDRAEPVVAVFLDLTVRGGRGGRDIIEELRRSFPDLPVFASSGFSEDPVMANAKDFGFTDSLRKPFQATELAELLNRHVPAEN